MRGCDKLRSRRKNSETMAPDGATSMRQCSVLCTSRKSLPVIQAQMSAVAARNPRQEIVKSRNIVILPVLQIAAAVLALLQSCTGAVLFRDVSGQGSLVRDPIAGKANSHLHPLAAVKGERRFLRLRGGSSWDTWGASSGSFGSNKKAYNPENDPEVPLDQCPNDGITELHFSPRALAPKNFLVASTWEGEVRCWEVDGSGRTTPVGMQKHEKPALCCAWKGDGTGIVSGGADGKVMQWDIGNGGWRQVGSHEGPVSCVSWAELPTPCVVSGSWDKTVKFWDPTAASGQPLGTLQLPDRVYVWASPALDVVGCVMVVATAERHILVYNLRNPAQPFRQKHSPLKYQTRSVAIFPDQSGFCVGSVEGRVGVEHIQDEDLPKNFAFKCHRQNADSKDPDLYAVNSIAFHPVGTFATAGGDGAFNFWDKDAKHRLKQFQRADQPVTSSTFSHDGALYAYSVCYDWSKGVGEFAKLSPEGRKARVMIHLVKQEAQPKKDSKRW